MFTHENIWHRSRAAAFPYEYAVARSIEKKDVTKLAFRDTSQLPIGDDVSAYTRCAAA
jgi:hypothetical protein